MRTKSIFGNPFLELWGEFRLTSFDVVNEISPSQCRTARAALGWTQGDLHERSKVGITSIKRFEAGVGTLHAVLVAELRRTLEAGGVVFLEPGRRVDGHVVRLGVMVVDP